ncbi:hypothetical protein LUZ60_017050 [Juncus effusus]|nr:hypothetical protein LUZ60_017050 [Juncus effusus]
MTPTRSLGPKMRIIHSKLLIITILNSILIQCTFSLKECTNSPTQLSSHTKRAQLSESQIKELIKNDYHSHMHLTPSDESAWMDLHPRKLLNRDSKILQVADFDWLMLYRSIKGSSHSMGPTLSPQQGSQFLSEVSLHDVRLTADSVYAKAQQTNLEYLLLLDVDSLVWSFRKQAGLSTPGEPYGGWERPDVELRGHFVGHYLSATAHAWASTHNETLFTKMSAVLSALDKCQKAIGSGYLSAFPEELFDRFEAIQPVWAPYYTIHKIMAGLLDQYLYGNSETALEMVKWMAEYFGNRVKNVIQKYSIERHYTSLNEEVGGMNDVLYKLYTITKDEKHLVLAHLFDKPCFLGLLAVQADSLSGFHANTHIPLVIGAQMRYEVTGDSLYKEIGTFFMDIVNSSHAYATGGTSVSEFWADPKRLADRLTTETEESCTTYNMLKISRNLLRWTKEVTYADYYERALINGVLSIQRGTEPGVMIYMLPQGPGSSKAVSYHGWGNKFNSFWCCYGTGIESFSKLGDSIYFEQKGGSVNSLYIAQFIPSSFNWRSAGLSLTLDVKPLSSSDSTLRVSLTVSPNESSNEESTIFIRVPSWTSLDSFKASLNSQDFKPTLQGNFISITKTWASNDNIALEFPISLRTEQIKDDRSEYSSLQGILFGPHLLAGLTTRDWDAKSENSSSVSDWISPVPDSYKSQLVSLTQQISDKMFYLSNSNNSLKMQPTPKPGNYSAVQATFRIYPQDFKSSEMKVRTNSYVLIEPFDLPGSVITNTLSISGTKGSDSTFKIVPGLDGTNGSVSLEVGTKVGCYLSTGSINYENGQKLRILCKGSKVLGDDDFFNKAASFIMVDGVRRYDPISFIAKGQKRNFVLEPLAGLRDEFYTLYFNVGA